MFHFDLKHSRKVLTLAKYLLYYSNKGGSRFRLYQYSNLSMNTTLLGEGGIENNVGISSFANKADGFQGINKQRYSDFIVREVDANGIVSFLRDISGSALESASFTTNEPNDKDNIIISAADNIEIVMKELMTKVDPIFKENNEEAFHAMWDSLKNFLLSCVEKSEDCENDINAFPCAEKTDRTIVHQILRAKLGKFVESDTLTKDNFSYIRIIAKHKQKSNNNSNQVKRKHWPSKLGNYLKFTLFKENIDTMSACNVIAKSLFLNSGNSIEYAGTKDKRAITSQNCTIYRKRPSDFAKINKFNFPPFIRIGNFEYVDKPIGLGDLSGNRFTLTLRSLNREPSIVLKACNELQKSGFINYFGLQRFGKGGSGSHQIGAALLKGQWNQAVDMLFTFREGDRDEVHGAKQAYQDKHYKLARDLLPPQMYSEKCVLDALIHNPNDFLGAYNRINKNTRLLCSHAYQSFIFNKAASYRTVTYGLTCVVGDLVALHEEVVQQVDDESILNNSNNIEEKSLSEKEAKITSLQSTTILTDEFQRASKVQTAGIHVVTLDDIEKNLFTIKDVILPLPGSEVIYPQHLVNEQWYADEFAKDGLTLMSFITCSSTYRTRGAYRRLIQFPKDFEWDLKYYNDPNSELVETELKTFKNYTKKSPNASAVMVSPTTESSTTPSTNLSMDVSDKMDLVTKDTHTAVVLHFTLPPGTYATMLLRELTKESTETQYQAQLSYLHTESSVSTAIEKGEDSIPIEDETNKEENIKKQRLY